ncbi:MAG: hypothetical protein JW808_03675 [Victivallales bacterium]|nr:hypothetical protein [Victivallales bacterium]
MICPYCEVEISLTAVDAEDGCCPECGMMLTPSTIFADEDDDLFDDGVDERGDIDDLDDLDDDSF